MSKILVHLDGGVGNIIVATPALASLAQSGHQVDLYIRGDFDGMAGLFQDWPLMRKVSVDASDFVGQEYDYYLMSWLAAESLRFKNSDHAIIFKISYPKEDFERVSEADVFLYYAEKIDPKLKITRETYCGHSARIFPGISKQTLVIFPGCKKEYAMKRWDKFDRLAEKFYDVAVVGIEDDVDLTFSYSYPEWIRKLFGKWLNYAGRAKALANLFGRRYNHPQKFGPGVKNYIGKLNLADTAALISQAGCFVGNDGGISHVAAALGIPTFFIFGPSNVNKAFVQRKNITIIKNNLDCQPCQSGGKYPQAWRFGQIGCPIGVKCLTELSVEDVYKTIVSKWTSGRE